MSEALALLVAITIYPLMWNWLVSHGSGTAQMIASFARRLATERPVSTPDEGRWGDIPTARDRSQLRAPDRQSPLAALPVGLLDQFFRASGSGSVTVTTTA